LKAPHGTGLSHKDDEVAEYILEKVKEKLMENDNDDEKSKQYDYENAGDKAPEEVREAIEKFKNLDPNERETNILLYWLLGSGTPPYKMSKEDSEYVDGVEDGNQVCANCEFMYQKVPSGEYICSQIRGKIKPGGWCKLWKQADNVDNLENLEIDLNELTGE